MLRRRHLTAATLAATALAVAGIAAPGAADTSDVTVTVNAGSLVLDAPATVSGAGSPSSTLNLIVPGILVDDDRGSLAGWTATATMTDLVTDDGADPGETMPASQMLWTTTTIAPQEGQVAVTAPAAGSPETGAVVAVGLPGLSPGAYSIDGQLTVNVPVNAYAGDYSGTLTTTIA